jgi:hypothetical protein
MKEIASSGVQELVSKPRVSEGGTCSRVLAKREV